MEKKLNSLLPKYPRPQFGGPNIPTVYLRAYRLANMPSTTESQAVQFFTFIISLINMAEGNSPEEKEFKVGTTTIQNGREEKQVCRYLGTPVAHEGGCKQSSVDEKLKMAVKVMMELIKTFLTNVADKDAFDKSEKTMESFEKAIRTLVYFYSSKVKPAILANDDPFITFFNEVNALFPKVGNGTKRELIRVTCTNKKEYTCGRIVGRGKCESENGRYYIVIDQTESEYNDRSSSTYGERVIAQSSTCGGRRKKTRKQKQKKSSRKNRKTRALSKRR